MILSDAENWFSCSFVKACHADVHAMVAALNVIQHELCQKICLIGMGEVTQLDLLLRRFGCDSSQIVNCLIPKTNS